MAKAPKAADGEQEEKQAFTPPPEPKLPSKDGRKHKATFAKDKYERGYNVRIVGPRAAEFSQKWVPVTRMDGGESMEFCLERLWKGMDDDTKQPVALFSLYKKPRDQDEIPF